MSPRKPNSRAKSKKPRRLYEAGPLPIPRELLTAGIELDAEEDIKRQRRLEGVKAALLQAFAAGRGEGAVPRPGISGCAGAPPTCASAHACPPARAGLSSTLTWAWAWAWA